MLRKPINKSGGGWKVNLKKLKKTNKKKKKEIEQKNETQGLL